MNKPPIDPRPLLVLMILAVFFLQAAAAQTPQAPVPAGVVRVLSGQEPLLVGGGPAPIPEDFITDAQREELRKAVDANIESLRHKGRLAPLTPTVHPLFGWPLRLAAGINDPGYHGISNFVDLNPSYPDQLLDYNCGTRSYDRPDGYNHGGSDIFTWPWPWRKMDRKEVEIVAAAPGQIIYRSDGNFDRSCGFNNNNWNAIFVLHADGSVAWYGHMKDGSPTPKQVGEFVAQGEYLGVVGSSGNSTGPHLHFEVHDSGNQLIEPWFGPCNTLNPESWWAAQRPYYDSAVDRMTTGLTSPTFFSCPTDEEPNARASFAAPPLTIYFTTYYRDQLDVQSSLYTVRRPDDTIYAQWSHSSPVPHYAGSYWFFAQGISAGEMQGLWKFTVDFNSSHYEQLFTIGNPGACGTVPEKPAQGELLLLQKISSSIKLTWGASCNAADTDYVVYQGTIGSYYSHTRILCSTGGGRAAVLSTAPAGSYFLVGPRNATREGSLGQSSSLVERPGGTISCFPRLMLPCP